MGTLREATIRLAQSHPDLRPHLLKILAASEFQLNDLRVAEAEANMGKVAAPPSEVGEIILQQMGGKRRLMMMLGIKTPFYGLGGGQGVGFMWPNRERSKGNVVEVELQPSDTYQVRFYNLAGTTKKLVKQFDDIYAEDLVGVFERQTGWYLRI